MEYFIGLILIVLFILLIQINNKVANLQRKDSTADSKLNTLYQTLTELKSTLDRVEYEVKKHSAPYDPFKVDQVDATIKEQKETLADIQEIATEVSSIVEPVVPIKEQEKAPEVIHPIEDAILMQTSIKEKTDDTPSTTDTGAAQVTPPPYPHKTKVESTTQKIEVEVQETTSYHQSTLNNDLFFDGIINKVKNVNWLNAIGIITLVLGLGFFVKYAIDKDWINEVGRVALGIAVGGVIIGIAHKLSSKYHVFSSILMGGGFATLYTTITLAFREYQIFGQTTAFAILIVITVLAILLSLAYKRQELAIFAFIGGMLSPLLVSTGNGNHVVLFSYIFLLNTGVLVVAVREKWLVIDKFSFVLTYLYMMAWFSSKYKVEYMLETILFNAAFFVQFMLLLVLRYINLSKEKSNLNHLIYIVSANFMALLQFFMIHTASNTTNYFGVIIIGMALVNALFIVLITRSKTAPIDKNFTYTLLALTIGLVSLSIPVQLSKVYITLVWAVEMCVLLWIWTRTKANLFRVGALLIGLFTIFSYVMDIIFYSPEFDYNPKDETSTLLNAVPIILNSYTITGIVVLLAFGFAYYTLHKHPVEESETIGFKSFSLPTTTDLKTVFYALIVTMLYVVPFLEIGFQVEARVDGDVAIPIYKNFCLTVYTSLFAIGYLILYKKQVGKKMYLVHLLLAIILHIAFMLLTENVRAAIAYYQTLNRAMFIPHLFGFGALIYYNYWLYKNRTIFEKSFEKWLLPLVFVLLVLVCSVELGNVFGWVVADKDNYFAIMTNISSYGYPILWGLMAMSLMIFGINTNQADHRKLSLISFGVLIVKFYAYDVSRMTQAGKIISFVVLGIIILIASFLLERIKLLLKDQDSQKTTEDQEEK
ncbi:MAG: DUF2339 domain-containing protein [Flavobacteriaceae bacterium]|jgi:uncharacterized membrane protein|nr:DUF2339 domain-containing protein [Flavobacteriaceae bacterium]